MSRPIRSEQTLHLQFVLGRLNGLITLPDDGWPFKCYSMVALSNSFVFSLCIVLTLLNAASVTQMIEITLLSTSFVLTVIKSLLYRRHYDQIRAAHRLMASIEASDAALQASGEGQRLMRHASRLSRRILVCFWLLYYLGISMVSVGPFRRAALIYDAIYPFDWNASRFVYLLTFFYQLLSNVQIANLLVILDPNGPTMYFFLMAYIDILNIRMDNIGRSVVAGRKSSSVPYGAKEELQTELKECIKEYDLCLKLSAILNEIFGVHYAIQFGASSFIICIIAFKCTLINPLEEPMACVFMFAYIVTMSMQIFLPCYCGSEISARSDAIMTSVYRCQWLGQSKPFHQSQLILMERAKQPIVLSIYKQFCAMQLPTFVKVVRFAYSLLMFLKSFQ